MIKSLLSFLAGLTVALLLGVVTPAAAQDYSPVKTHDVAPEYPRSALRKEIEGWVDLRLTISPDGKVEDIEIVAAEPRRVFERAAIRAATRWEFEPPSRSGFDEALTGTYRINFSLN